MAAEFKVNQSTDEGERLRALYAARAAAAGKQARPPAGRSRPDGPPARHRPISESDAALLAHLGRVIRGVQPGSEEAGGDRREAPHAPQADAAPQAPPTSLVLCSESVPDEDPNIRGIGADEICPKRPYVVVADDDPTLRYPASCDAYSCETCGPRKAQQAAALATWAIRKADRARFVTLTQAPEQWQPRRKKVRVLAEKLRKAGYKWETAWTTEAGKQTGMIHVHALQHGSYVPQRVLQEVWGARVDIRKVQTGGVAQYVTKDALKVAGYIVKDATAEHSGLAEHLALNGGRAMHWSRGFLHGLDRRRALADLRNELAAGLPHDWHLELWDASRGPTRDDLNSCD
ncbi:MAG TPA: hypothetical protein VIP98_05355 [Microlunatus sp.]